MENNNIKIEVLGSNCPTCKRLHEIVKEVVLGMDLKTEVAYSSDIQKIINLGMMQSPVLAVNGRVALAGFSSDKDRIKKLIANALQTPLVSSNPENIK